MDFGFLRGGTKAMVVGSQFSKPGTKLILYLYLYNYNYNHSRFSMSEIHGLTKIQYPV